jgi:hypothetical protein
VCRSSRKPLNDRGAGTTARAPEPVETVGRCKPILFPSTEKGYSPFACPPRRLVQLVEHHVLSVFVWIEYLFEVVHCVFLGLDAVLESGQVFLVTLPAGAKLV